MIFNQNKKSLSLNRRQFLQASGAAGLLISFSAPGIGAEKKDKIPGLTQSGPVMGNAALAPNAFVRVGEDNLVTVIVKHIEIGQGAYTAMASLVAEELDANWAQMRAEAAPANTELYANLSMQAQAVGGSSGLSNSYEQLRKAGAGVRLLMVAAAAEAWDVPASKVTVARGLIREVGGDRTATFGEMANRAALLVDSKRAELADPPLKDPDDFVIIGKEKLTRIDSEAKTNGTAEFTLDKYMPDMLTVVVAHPPKIGAKLQSYSAREAKRVPGVVAVHAVSSGVAVYGTNTYAALTGRRKLDIKWNDNDAETQSTEQIYQNHLDKANRADGISVTKTGDVNRAFEQSETMTEHVFRFPYLAHAPMEPLDAVIIRNTPADVRMGKPTVQVWMGSQLQTFDQQMIAETLDTEPAQVELNTMLGGGTFGRRAQPGSVFAVEAAEVAKAMPVGTPIKLMWTREDDIQGGYYRPLAVHVVKASQDKAGEITGWQHTLAIRSFIRGSMFDMMIQNDIDPTTVEGIKETPYDIKNYDLSLQYIENPVTGLWWRSVGHTHTNHVLEVMLDTMFEKANLDPIQARLDLIKDSPRDAAVLKEVNRIAEASGEVPEGRARGVALAKSFGTYVAQIAEVSKGADGLPKVHKVWCAVDCGLAVNPDVVHAQMEGGIGFGLGAVLYDEITFDDQGNVEQSNFDTYRSIRINEMPEIEVAIVNSGNSPTGVGEPSVPPIGPAVTNAWRRLTGQMVTTLPFTKGVPEAQSVSDIEETA